jgi:hypothetical protein
MAAHQPFLLQASVGKPVSESQCRKASVGKPASESQRRKASVGKLVSDFEHGLPNPIRVRPSDFDHDISQMR